MTSDQKASKIQRYIFKGQQALDYGNYELAIDMFDEVLRLDYTSTYARKNMRAAQVALFKKSNLSSMSLSFQKFKKAFAAYKAKSLIKCGRGQEAMAIAETLLKIDPLDKDYIDIAVKAAEVAKLPEAAAITVEAAYTAGTKDVTLLKKVATYYTIAKNYDKAVDTYKKILEITPSDQSVLQLLKNTEAQRTISDGWEQTAGKVGGTRDLIRDKEEAERLDRGNKAEMVGDDIDKAAVDYIKRLEAIPHDVFAARALSRLYIKAKRYKEAIDVLEKVTKLVADPELDKMLSNAKLLAFSQLIAEKEKLGEDVTQIKAERDAFELEDLSSRVERYPNDGGLRFELGSLLVKHERYDEAIVHLQVAQKSLKNRLNSLYLLAKCFIAKGQRDLGVMQLETAAEAIPTMTELKMKVIYELAACAEAAGDNEKAYNYYKDIYSNDVTFMDVEAKMLELKKRT